MGQNSWVSGVTSRQKEQDFVQDFMLKLFSNRCVPHAGEITTIALESMYIPSTSQRAGRGATHKGPTHHAQKMARQLKRMKELDIAERKTLTQRLMFYGGVPTVRKIQLVTRIYDRIIKDWMVVSVTGKAPKWAEDEWWTADELYRD